MRDVFYVEDGKLLELKPRTLREYALSKLINDSSLVKLFDTEYERFDFPPCFDVYLVNELGTGYNDNIFVSIDYVLNELIIYEGDGNNIVETIDFEVR